VGSATFARSAVATSRMSASGAVETMTTRCRAPRRKATASVSLRGCTSAPAANAARNTAMESPGGTTTRRSTTASPPAASAGTSTSARTVPSRSQRSDVGAGVAPSATIRALNVIVSPARASPGTLRSSRARSGTVFPGSTIRREPATACGSTSPSSRRPSVTTKTRCPVAAARSSTGLMDDARSPGTAGREAPRTESPKRSTDAPPARAESAAARQVVVSPARNHDADASSAISGAGGRAEPIARSSRSESRATTAATRSAISTGRSRVTAPAGYAIHATSTPAPMAMPHQSSSLISVRSRSHPPPH
jgi:hypothetical protein